MKKPIILLLMAWLSIASAWAQHPTGKVARSIAEQQAKGIQFEEWTIAAQAEPLAKLPLLHNALHEGTLIVCNSENLRSLARQQPAHLRLRIPQYGQKDLELQLQRFQPFAPDMVVTAGPSYTVQEVDLGVHYAGTVAGVSGSLAAVSVFADRIAAVISVPDEGNIVLGQIEGVPGEKRHVLYREKDLKGRNYFTCETADMLPRPPKAEDVPVAVEKATDPSRTVRIFAVADDDLYRDKGSSVPTTAQYVSQVLAQCAILFSNESVNTQVSQIHVWDGWDPYPNVSSSDLLQSFEDNHPTFNGNVAHLLHTKSNASGGIANLGFSFCSKLYGISKINTTYSNVPTYSWTINVVTHELGHNFGSNHTHACVWNGNNTRIDNCGGNAGYTEGMCNSNPPNPVGGGTIMSYCHLIDGVGVNFNNGFGTQPGNLIRHQVHNSSCLEGPVANMVTSGEQTVEFNNSYTDLLIPVNLPASVYALRLLAKGGDGGVADGRGDCNGNGGVGATIEQTFRLSSEGMGLVPGSTLRFIVGGAGESPSTNDLTRALGAGGGGGTGILLKPPTSGGFGLLIAAGGGGGGYSGTAFGDCVTKRNGGGGSVSFSGSSGSGNNAGSGGGPGNGGNRGGLTGILSGGGGGANTQGQDIDCAFTSDRGGGKAGGQTGGQGGISCTSAFSMDGGFGYGGGGAGKEAGAGGGGGGYAGGGGGGEEGGGGGGGSYYNLSYPGLLATNTSSGSNTSSPANGLARYQFIHDQTPPVASCVSSYTLALDPTGTATLHAAALNNASTDAETGINPNGFSVSPSAFSCVHTGSQTVTLTVRDKAGNSATCQTTITVVDNTPPILSCAPLTVVLNAQGTASIIPYQLVADLFDACGIASLTASQTNFNCNHVGQNTITITATDNNGNSSVCQSTVTVVDVTPPVIQCTNISITFNGEAQIALPLPSITSASDACGIQSLSIQPNTIPCEAVGQTITVTATARDVNNNQSTCTSQVTVLGLPCGWSQQPNGIGCTNGSQVAYDPIDEYFTLTSTGCYFMPTSSSDQMAYAKRRLCGNGEIIAKVNQLNGLGWAGIIMRENDDPGSKKVALLLNFSNFLRRESRTQTNGPATVQQIMSGGATWLRLVRQGSQIIGYFSANGQQWQMAMAINMVLPSCIDMGLVVTNAQANATISGVFSNVSFIGASTLATPQTTMPEALREEQVMPFPNPAHDVVQFELNPEWGAQVRVEIMHSTGRILHSAVVDAAGGGLFQHPVNRYETGYYFIRVSPAGRAPITGRVLVARRP